MILSNFIWAIVIMLLTPAIRASMVTIPVDAENIQQTPLAVTAKEEDSGKTVSIRVLADAKGPPFATGDYMQFSLGSGNLRINDGKRFVASCSVAMAKAPSGARLKGISNQQIMQFEFQISAQYLPDSVFEIWYVSGTHPAIENYRLMLSSFHKHK